MKGTIFLPARRLITAFRVAALCAAFAVLAGCGSSPRAGGSGGGSAVSGPARTEGGDEIVPAIREISDYLNSRITQGSKAVFLNIKSDYPDLSEYIINGLSENAVNDGVFSVVDRQQLDAIRAELDFQWSGEVSDASAQEIGEMTGAQAIVSGSINKIGPVYRIQVRAISVKTAEVQGQFSQNVDSGGAIVAALTERLVPAASSPAPARGSQNATQPAAESQGARQQPAPIVVERQPAAPAQAALRPGTYTFYPRPQANQGGVDKNVYLDRITVRGTYFTMYFTGRPQGKGGDGDYGPFWNDQVLLTDLNRPSRTWNFISKGEDDVTDGFYLTFQGVTAARFSLSGNSANPPYAFEEIVLGEPD